MNEIAAPVRAKNEASARSWVARPCLLFLLIIGAPLNAGASASYVSSGPYCGVYSMYAAFRTEGMYVTLTDLLKPEYISRKDGSTLSDLERAARDHHAECVVLTHLDLAALRRASAPVILHVKSECDAPDYNHFILCVPTRRGDLALYDPPGPVLRTAGHELAAIWGGTGIMVASHPVPIMPLRVAAFRPVASGILAAAIVVILSRLVRRRRPLSRDHPRRLWSTSLAQCAGVFCAAAVLGGGYHLLSRDGFRAQRDAVAAIGWSRFAPSPAVLSVKQVREIPNGAATFIDARHLADYETGHLPAAINIPPTSTRWDRSRALVGVAKSARLVVYCQSASCSYSRFVARRLSADGYTDVSILPGGWDEWVQSKD